MVICDVSLLVLSCSQRYYSILLVCSTILYCTTLCYTILHYAMLYYTILYYTTLVVDRLWIRCHLELWGVLDCRRVQTLMMTGKHWFANYIVLYCILYCSALDFTLLYTVLFYIILCYTILLYHSRYVLYDAILYYVILYYTIHIPKYMYYTILWRTKR